MKIDHQFEEMRKEEKEFADEVLPELTIEEKLTIIQYYKQLCEIEEGMTQIRPNYCVTVFDKRAQDLEIKLMSIHSSIYVLKKAIAALIL